LIEGGIMTKFLRVALMSVLLVALVVLVGCSGSSSGGATSVPPAGGSTSSGGSGSSGASSSSGGTSSSGSAVSIANFAFSPPSLTIKAGQTVTWTNNDSVAHTITADDNSFDSGQVAPGATYQHTFAKAGTVSYHCSIHPSMTANITVQ
jgi:plastocyanin